MATIYKNHKNTVFIPVPLEELALGLGRLKRSELETLELLLDRNALRVIGESRKQAIRGKMRRIG